MLRPLAIIMHINCRELSAGLKGDYQGASLGTLRSAVECLRCAVVVGVLLCHWRPLLETGSLRAELAVDDSPSTPGASFAWR